MGWQPSLPLQPRRLLQGEMWQPIVAAVNSVNTSINGTAHVLAARLNSTAVKLTESAAGYTAQDETSGSDISSIVV